jgi:hypothetical protein
MTDSNNRKNAESMKKNATESYAKSAEKAEPPEDKTLENMSLIQRVSAMCRDPRVSKLANDAYADTGKFSYEYHSPAQLQMLVRDVAPVYGLFVWPTERKVEYIQNIDAHATVTYEILNLDEPFDSAVRLSVTGYGMGTGNNADGKALTYASRRALMVLFGIASGDDQSVADDYSVSRMVSQSGNSVTPPVPPHMTAPIATPHPAKTQATPARPVPAGAPKPTPSPALAVSRGQIRQEAIMLYGNSRLSDDAAQKLDVMLRNAQTEADVQAAAEYLNANKTPAKVVGI